MSRRQVVEDSDSESESAYEHRMLHQHCLIKDDEDSQTWEMKNKMIDIFYSECKAFYFRETEHSRVGGNDIRKFEQQSGVSSDEDDYHIVWIPKEFLERENDGFVYVVQSLVEVRGIYLNYQCSVEGNSMTGMSTLAKWVDKEIALGNRIGESTSVSVSSYLRGASLVEENTEVKYDEDSYLSYFQVEVI